MNRFMKLAALVLLFGTGTTLVAQEAEEKPIY